MQKFPFALLLFSAPYIMRDSIVEVYKMRTYDDSIIYGCLNGKLEAFAVLIDKYKEGIYANNKAKANKVLVDKVSFNMICFIW